MKGVEAIFDRYSFLLSLCTCLKNLPASMPQVGVHDTVSYCTCRVVVFF